MGAHGSRKLTTASSKVTTDKTSISPFNSMIWLSRMTWPLSRPYAGWNLYQIISSSHKLNAVLSSTMSQKTYGISDAKIEAIIEGLNGARILVRFIGDDIFRKSWNSAAFVNKPTELGSLYCLLSE